jgi:hypothetical protein
MLGPHAAFDILDAINRSGAIYRFGHEDPHGWRERKREREIERERERERDEERKTGL